MLRSIWVVLAMLTAGEIVVWLLHLPLPASVMGLLFLFESLRQGWIKEEEIKPLADSLLGHLMLLLVPPCVAVMNYFEVLQKHAFAIIVASVGSTLFLLWFSAWLYRRVRTW